MERTAIIQKFCNIVNEGLPAHNHSHGAKMATFEAELTEHDDLILFEDLKAAFAQAYKPEHFYEVNLTGPDAYFEQCYELMHLTFKEDELEPFERYVGMITAAQDPNEPYPNVIIGRFWDTTGPCIYNKRRLVHFEYNPLHRVSHIMAMVNGNYMPILTPPFEKDGIGAIGHVAPYPPLPEHNKKVLELFETEMKRVAERRGETMRLCIVESDDVSDNFYYTAGYRWPIDSKYYQPPMEFYPETGEPLYDEMLQTLMVKIADKPRATEIDCALILAASRTMDENWCLAGVEDFPSEAAQAKARAYVNSILQIFEESLPEDSPTVSLGAPEH